jgi:hypothetical protein
MNCEIIVFKDRVPYLVKELGDAITVVREWDKDMELLSVNLKDDTDVIKFFHAGINYGLKFNSR